MQTNPQQDPVHTPLKLVQLTPPGRGAVAVILLEGPNALRILEKNWLGPSLVDSTGQPRAETPIFGRFRISTAHQTSAVPDVFEQQGVFEEIVVHAMQRDAVEIHCHGGSAVVAAIEKVLKSDGAASANDGTSNGSAAKTIRTQEELAAQLLPFAPSMQTFQILLDQMNGAMKRECREIQNYSLEKKRWRFQRWRQNARLGRHLVEPFHIVLAGAANAGKSSLFNAILGFQRSLIHATPGTTRDVVSAQTAIEGFPMMFHDTAGFRALSPSAESTTNGQGLRPNTQDDLERQGIFRSAHWMSRADLVIWVSDITQSFRDWPEDLHPALDPKRTLFCDNKSDLLPTNAQNAAASSDKVVTSAMTGAGLETLMTRIFQRLIPRIPEPLEAVPLARMPRNG